MTYLVTRQEPARERLLVGATQAAELLAISERHLARLTQTGEVPSLLVAGCRRYSIDSLRAYISQQESAARPASTPAI